MTTTASFEKVVLGLDPSLTGTGIAIAGHLDIIETQPAGSGLMARYYRLLDIAERVMVIADEDTWGLGQEVDLIVIEAPSLGQRTQAGTLDRNGLWWLLIHHLPHDTRHGIIDVPPTTLKKFATGRGNATKSDMRMALYQRAGLDVRDDNQVDAWWLQQVGYHILDDPAAIPLPSTHTAALAKLRVPEVAP